MIRKLFFLITTPLFLISCQFTETMVLNEDGSGTMSVNVNMNEMMAFSGMGATDSLEGRLDTIIRVKQFLEEKKDSISKLPMEDQLKLKKLENYNVRVIINSETSEMIYDISSSFKSVSEVNDIVNGLDQAANFMPGPSQEENLTKEEETGFSDIIGVSYSFEKGLFKRDAYIKDKKRHQKEVDSLKQSEAFLGSANYTLNYTFPKPIKKVSDPAATISSDKKSLTLKKAFTEYFKNPDLLDLEVELEK